MRPISRIIAAIASAALTFSVCSCNNKKSSESSDTKPASSSEASTTSESSDLTTTASETKKTTADAVSATTSTETTSTAATTAAETKKPEETAEKPTEAPKKGFDSCIDAAKAYYDAYLKSDANAVYDMFCTEEIDGYNSFLNSSDYLDGQNPQVVFKRSNVISAIEQSMKAIHDIMAEKSDVPADKWTAPVSEDLLKPTGENELVDFNKTLGTKFTSGYSCGYVYYKDGSDEHDFIGNGCAFVELDGRWYLSYTTVMNAELLTYMDIF